MSNESDRPEGIDERDRVGIGDGAGDGRLIVISGPSGAGKSTVLKMLLEQCPLPLALSVSATTRAPRPGEIDGFNYWFLTQEQFQARRAAGDFLEFFEVFGRGQWYGTLRETVTSGLKAGKWVILEIDVHGAQSVAREFPDAITLFIHPGDMAELERRLRGRKTESEEAIAARLETAHAEIALKDWYRHIVINDDPRRCSAEICKLLQKYSGKD